MSTMILAFDGTLECGQFLGDTIVSIKVAHLMAQAAPCSRYLLTLHRQGQLNFLWRRFVDRFGVTVIHTDFQAGNMDERFRAWDSWRRDRKIGDTPIDAFRELYRRIDGGHRQGQICGSERGLGRRNIFEYMYFGQENKPEGPCEGGKDFGDDLIYWEPHKPEWDLLIAPAAKCQGNGTFTFQFWDKVVRSLVGQGVRVSVNHNGEFCEDLAGQCYQRVFPSFRDLIELVCRVKLSASGNTGVMWAAAACGTPVLVMQPPDSNMQDYRAEWCGLHSLVDFVEVPDAADVVRRIMEFLDQKTVLTTGCFDVLHAGHVRHLEESRSFGTKLVVALNSDASVLRLKGEGRPLNPQAERESVLRALRCVDDVRIFDGDDATDVIHRVRPAVLTNGADHKREEIVGKDFVEACGGQVLVTSGNRTETSTKIIQKVVRQVDVLQAVRDAAALSPNPQHKMRVLADEFLSVKDLPGAVADVGAYRGGCSLLMRRIAPDKELHLFDTWSGTPHDDPLCHHKRGEWAADLAECRRVVGGGPLTHYHAGVFPGTAETVKDGRFCFVLIDGDTYQTTRDAIEFFWPRLVDGGKLFLDDVPWEPCAGVEKALGEAFPPEKQQRKPEANACVVVKK